MQLSNIVRVGALLLAVSHALALPRGFDTDSSAGELVESSEPTVDDVGDVVFGEEDADEFGQGDEDAADELAEGEPTFEDEASVEEDASEDLNLEDDAAGANATVTGMEEDPFLQLGEWPEPFQPSCESNAMRAMWKWRANCENGVKRVKWQCWNKAPSPKMCCNWDQPGEPALFMKSCGKYWPKGSERWMCAKDCDVPTWHRLEKLKVTEETCNFSKKSDKEVNNPKKICKCMVKGCP